MPRRKSKEFICLWSAPASVDNSLFGKIIGGKNGEARARLIEAHLSPAQAEWLNTVRHWYLHCEYDKRKHDYVLRLLLLKEEQERSPENILLGYLLFS